MSFYVSTATFFLLHCDEWEGPRCSSAETQVCHRSYIIAARVRVTLSLVLYICLVDRCLTLCTFSFGHCVVLRHTDSDYLPLVSSYG